VIVVGLTLSCREESGKEELSELSKKEEVVPKDMGKPKLPDTTGIPLGKGHVFPREGPEVIRFDPENERSKIANKLGVEGQAILKVFVNREGGVGEVKIYQSSGHASLDTVAIRIAKDMRFKPALHREKPVGVWISIPVPFRIDTLQAQREP
jgi:TonB family protein